MNFPFPVPWYPVEQVESCNFSLINRDYHVQTVPSAMHMPAGYQRTYIYALLIDTCTLLDICTRDLTLTHILHTHLITSPTLQHTGTDQHNHACTHRGDKSLFHAKMHTYSYTGTNTHTHTCTRTHTQQREPGSLVSWLSSR